MLEKVKAGELEHTLEYPIAGYRIDDFVFLSMPGEPFVGIQLGHKEHSRAKHTMFAGYANGILAYIAGCADHPPGWYVRLVSRPLLQHPDGAD